MRKHQCRSSALLVRLRRSGLGGHVSVRFSTVEVAACGRARALVSRAELSGTTSSEFARAGSVGSVHDQAARAARARPAPQHLAGLLRALRRHKEGFSAAGSFWNHPARANASLVP
ncbi:hypothetical protein ISCGN_030887 [Ixodes scapularis]